MPTTATATTLTITRWRAMGFLEARVAAVALPADQRRTLLAEMGVDEVESLLEHAFFYGDPVYRDQVVDRLVEIDPARGAGPRRPATERDALGLVGDPVAGAAADAEEIRRHRAAIERRLAEETAQMGGTRGLGPGTVPAMTWTVTGTPFLRTTEAVTADAETYTSLDGTVTLHQSRQDGTWRARERGWGSTGFQRHAAPEDALAEVTDRRAREAAQHARNAETSPAPAARRRRPVPRRGSRR